MVRCYLGLIDHAVGGFGIAFPDFPGCTAKGDTIAAAVEKGAEVLQAQVEHMQAHGVASPDPSALDAQVPSWLETGADHVRVRVPVRVRA